MTVRPLVLALWLIGLTPGCGSLPTAVVIPVEARGGEVSVRRCVEGWAAYHPPGRVQVAYRCDRGRCQHVGVYHTSNGVQAMCSEQMNRSVVVYSDRDEEGFTPPENTASEVWRRVLYTEGYE